MAMKDAQKVAEKYARRAGEALQDYLDGVDGVVESPTIKAAAKLDKAKANYIKAIDSGKMKRGLLRVSTEEWKARTKEKGNERYASGVIAAIPKMKDFMDVLLPFQEAGKKKIESMPDTTAPQMKARMNAWFDHMSTFKRNK